MKTTRIMEKCKTELPPASSTRHLPGALYTTKKLYKNPPIDRCIPYGNMMFDRRIVRGSNFSRHGVETPAVQPLQAVAKTESKCSLKVETPTVASVLEMINRPVQTELYLEELFENPPESEVGCQTDLFMDRRDSPRYMVVKTGLDVSTQIYPGELFNFDLEVQPIVEVIVGKTLEQCLVEVFEEDELASLLASQRRFEERRAAEEAERMRLEEEERRLEVEKRRRVEQFETAYRLQKEVEERVAAAVLTHGYLHDFLPDVLVGLRSAGYLLDNIKADVERGAVPWIWEDVVKHNREKVLARDILTEMVRDITDARALVYEVLGEKEDEIPKLLHTFDLLHEESDEEDIVLEAGDEWEIANLDDEVMKIGDKHGGFGTAPVTPEPSMVFLEAVQEEEPEGGGDGDGDGGGGDGGGDGVTG